MDRLALVGEIDVANRDDILAELLAAIDGILPSELEAMTEVEIDCSDVSYIDSSGLGMLVAFKKKTGFDLVLKNVSDRCRRPFVITGLDTLFAIR